MSGKALPCPLPRCSTQELQIVQVLHPCQAPQAVSQDACLAPKLSLWHNSSLVSPVRPASAVARDLAASGPSGEVASQTELLSSKWRSERRPQSASASEETPTEPRKGLFAAGFFNLSVPLILSVTCPVTGLLAVGFCLCLSLRVRGVRPAAGHLSSGAAAAVSQVSSYYISAGFAHCSPTAAGCQP